uniref:Uncharacterized protein n=1 Tax=Anopheles braziliensis TaxID=58242 RepID=A0A2M3ZLE2_9DIPT
MTACSFVLTVRSGAASRPVVLPTRRHCVLPSPQAWHIFPAVHAFQRPDFPARPHAADRVLRCFHLAHDFPGSPGRAVR